jgi:hypothetical protein
MHPWIWHWPATHVAVAFGSAQTWPHVPQLFGSVVSDTHVVPQSWVPGGQVQVLFTASQVALAGQQAVPQPTVPLGQVAVHVPFTQKAPWSQHVLPPLAFVQTRASGQQPVGVQVWLSGQHTVAPSTVQAWKNAQQTPPAQVSFAPQQTPLQRTPDAHSTHPFGPQIMPAGQQAPLQMTPLGHEQLPVLGSQVSPAGQQTPLHVGPAHEQAPLGVHVEPAGQQAPFAQATLPVGQGDAQAPFTQLVPAAQHWPPHIGNPLVSHTHTPASQVVPGGQQVLPQVFEQLVVPAGHAQVPRPPPGALQKPLQQSVPLLHPLPMSWQPLFGAAATDWPRPMAPSIPAMPPAMSVRSALRRDVPLAILLARSSKSPLFMRTSRSPEQEFTESISLLVYRSMQ